MAVWGMCKVACPNCNNVDEIKAFGLLSVLRDGNLMLKLIEGDVTNYICTSCGCKSEIDLPITVSTPGSDGKYIYYIPNSDISAKLIDAEETNLSYVLSDKCWENENSDTYTDWEKFIVRLKELLPEVYYNWEEEIARLDKIKNVTN